MPKRLIKNYHSEIVELWSSGKTPQDISNALNFNISNIRGYLRKHGMSSQKNISKDLGERVHELEQLYNDGLTYEEIGEKFGCSGGLIMLIFKKHSVIPARLQKAMDDSPELKKSLIIERYKNGESVYSLYKDLGIPYPTLCSALRRWGVDISSGRCTHPNGKLSDKTDEIVRLYTKEKIGTIKIANILGGSPANIRIILHQQGLMRTYDETLFDVNLNYFEQIDTPNKAFWLGFLFADGNVSKDIQRCIINIKATDIELLHKMKEEIGYTGEIRTYHYDREDKTSNPMSQLCISRGKICRDLVKLGCMPNKTWKVRFPDFLPPDLISHFCRGYWDGDGSVGRGYCCCSAIGNKFFIEGMAKILPCEISNIRYLQSIEFPDDPDKQTGTVKIDKVKEAKKCLRWLYGNCQDHLYLKRKYELAQKYI